ncbi:MAG: trypsin-like peptidase domain-containing protein [Acetobacteraceae bacterium]|nr:trypsin-like peptidase domain-containing protein [Acetobacteraceae bacterium]
MPHRCLFVSALLAALLILPEPPALASAQPDQSTVKMLHGVLPAVVNIETFRTAASGDKRGQWVRTFGSGFIISPDGTIVTNRHVIEGGEAIAVTFRDGTHALATVIGAAAVVDLALLRVSLPRELPALTFGDSDKVQIGDPVFTIGNGLDLGVSVSEGIVSALDRDIRTGPYDSYIQTDAALNHGNSGGPLVDASGKVIGVDTALVSPTTGYAGLGFAIPSNEASFIIQRLLKYGTVRAGWIGVQLQDMTADLAMGFGLPRPEGGIVVGVTAASPAEKAGIRTGDIITGVGGHSSANARQAMTWLARAEVGRPTTLTVFRNGAEQRIEVAVDELPGDRTPYKPTETSAGLAAIADQSDFGIKLTDVTASTNAHFGMDMKSGALVAAVAPGSAAGAAGLVPGDVILRVEDTTVANPTDFANAVQAARKLGRYFVPMLVQKKDERQWIAVFSRVPHLASPDEPMAPSNAAGTR